MATIKVVQTELLGSNGARIVTWLPVDPRVKPGVIVTLDKCTVRWEVLKQYSIVESTSIFRGWGLNLPRSQRTER